MYLQNSMIIYVDNESLTMIIYVGNESIATGKALFSSEKFWYLSYFSMKTYVVGTHYRRLDEALLMSTHNICFRWEIRKFLCGYPFLSVAMWKPYQMCKHMPENSFSHGNFLLQLFHLCGTQRRTQTSSCISPNSGRTPIYSLFITSSVLYYKPCISFYG